MRTLNKPLVTQELDEFYSGPLRDALMATDMAWHYGNAATGADIDEMAFDDRTNTALVEIIGDETNESGRVIAYGRGREAVFNAIAAFTQEFGAPATFVVELSDQPEPHVIRGNGAARIYR